MTEAALHSLLDSMVSDAYINGETSEVSVVIKCDDARQYVRHGAYVDTEGAHLIVTIRTAWAAKENDDEE